MDSSAVSDEERQEASPDRRTSPNKSLSKISGNRKGRGQLFCPVNESCQAAGRHQVTSRQPVGAQTLTDASMLQLWVRSSRANAPRRRWRDSTSRCRSRRRSSGSETVRVQLTRRCVVVCLWTSTSCFCFHIFRQRRETGRHPTHRLPDHQDETGRPEASARHPVRPAGEGREGHTALAQFGAFQHGCGGFRPEISAMQL